MKSTNRQSRQQAMTEKNLNIMQDKWKNCFIVPIILYMSEKRNIDLNHIIETFMSKYKEQITKR